MQLFLAMYTCQKSLPEGIKFDAIISIDAFKFRRMCRDLSPIPKNVTISCTLNEITFSCQTYGTTDVKVFKRVSEVHMPTDDGVEIYNATSQKIEVTIPFHYLKSFAKLVNIDENIWLRLVNRCVMRIDMNIHLLGKLAVMIKNESSAPHDNIFETSTGTHDVHQNKHTSLENDTEHMIVNDNISDISTEINKSMQNECRNDHSPSWENSKNKRQRIHSSG